MLSRYTIYRRRPNGAPPLPEGIRQDTRWRTRHVLRPAQEMVKKLLADPSESGWLAFETEYAALLKQRFVGDRGAFDQLARLASDKNVFLGCSCPTKKNPDVRQCHTYVAIAFMKSKFPALDVVFPNPAC